MTSNELKHKAKLQEWALTVQEWRSSGKPVKQWCIENKTKATTYYRREREIMGDAVAGSVQRRRFNFLVLNLNNF